MTDVTEKQPILAGKRVWVIDDDIPIRLSLSEYEDMLIGSRPIDRGTLAALLRHPDWGEAGPLRGLCEQLVSAAGDVNAFPQPAAAVAFMNRGALIPDIIVYDLKYVSLPTGTDSLQWLEEILRRCLAVVQVYAQDPGILRDRLKILQDKYPTRLPDPLSKGEVHAEGLAKLLDEKIRQSLSVQLAGEIRQRSSQAIEEALVRIDDLPLSVAIALLAGGSEDTVAEETISDTEIVELLSVKVANAIASAPELARAVESYVSKKGVPPGSVSRVVEEMVELMAAHVRAQIEYNGWLYEAIESAWEASNQGPDQSAAAKHDDIVQGFFAFRLYGLPGDDLVRTGDIVEWCASEGVVGDDPLPNLYLVLTPPCDLARFWKSTRGVLTLVRMYPMTPERGIQRVKSYSNTAAQDIHSVTARCPMMILPSVPLSTGMRHDYVLFVHEVECREIGEPAHEETKVKAKTRFQRPLTYKELNKTDLSVTRKCRVSEPFLSGILATLGTHLFRSGVPDFPLQERERLKGLLAK